MDLTNQKQSSGDNSFNLQAKSIVINGISLEQARQIALDVYRANALELKEIAQQTALHRAEAITDKFFSKLLSVNPSCVEASRDPDFQYTLFEAQKGFSRSGDETLGDLLVNLLVKRAEEKGRSLKQLVLNEAVLTIQKLTQEQIDVLTVAFLLRYTRVYKALTPQSFFEFIEKDILPLTLSAPKADSFYHHLVYTGTATVQMTSISLPAIFLAIYGGVFSKGLTQDQVNSIIKDDVSLGRFLIPCLRNKDLLQVRFQGLEVLNESLCKEGLEEDVIAIVRQLHNSGLLSENEVLSEIIESLPSATSLFQLWNSSALKNLVLTSVGIAIGHANACRLGTLKADLETWLS